MKNRESFLQLIFEKENLVEIVAYFETVFQMSILYFVQTSGFDRDDVIERLEDMGIQIDTDYLFDFLKDIPLLENESDDFEYIFPLLRKKAIEYALFEYLKSDKQLLNKNLFYESMIDEIQNGEYFNKDIDELVDNELPYRINSWNEIIDIDISRQILEVVLGDKEF